MRAGRDEPRTPTRTPPRTPSSGRSRDGALKAMPKSAKSDIRQKQRQKRRQKLRDSDGDLPADLAIGGASEPIFEIAADPGQWGSAHEQLMALMAALRRALVAGQIAQIPALSQRLAEAMAHYLDDGEGFAGDPAELVALRRAAETNARCLAATLAGLRAARRRLAEIHRMHRSMGYDRNGRSHLISAPETLARRV